MQATTRFHNGVANAVLEEAYLVFHDPIAFHTANSVINTIMPGGVAIGAIGVSGAPGGQFDEECARAALAKIQDRMK